MPFAWHTPATARSQWKGAPDGDTLDELLEYAKDECLRAERWTPAEGEDETARPIRFRIAQLAAAQAAWEYRRGNVDTGAMGLEGFSSGPRPRTVQTALATYLHITPRVG